MHPRRIASITMACLLFVWLFATPAQAGQVSANLSRSKSNHSIDMFLSAWQLSMPRAEHGSLVLRDILTRGDNLEPSQIGATLQYANFLAYGRLAPGAWTTPSKLERQQEIYYVIGGKGEITADGETAQLHKDVAVLMPEDLEFVMRCLGNEPLTMYVINEPIIAGFRPKNRMVVRDESKKAPESMDQSGQYILPATSAGRSYNVRKLFNRRDGLATEQSVAVVTLEPYTLSDPNTNPPGQEEVWAAIDGTSIAWIGTQLRIQKPGMAYMPPPDGETIHSNINNGDKPAKFLYFVRLPDDASTALNHDRK
jgi:mannose-6-phosphate isomerase-like protein (cupin superfamily)